MTDDQRQLIEANVGLARHMAIRHRPSARLHHDDRLGAALDGLVAAAIGYDPGRGKPFAAYAGPIIKRHVNLAIWGRGVVRLPTHLRRPVPNRREGTARAAERALQVGALDPDMASRSPGILEAMEAAEGRALAGERVPLMLARLDARSRSVLVARFGLDGRPPRTLAAIGAELGCTRERVRQIERDALATLRRRAAGPDAGPCGEFPPA